MSAPGPYGQIIAEHFRRPRNHGPLPGAHASAEGSNPLCGDRVRVAVTLHDAGLTIAEARFVANACAICVASASLLTERVRGMGRDAAALVTEAEVIGALGAEIPAARRRCATLPLEALRRAVAALGEGSAPRAET